MTIDSLIPLTDLLMAIDSLIPLTDLLMTIDSLIPLTDLLMTISGTPIPLSVMHCMAEPLVSRRI
jgi:hypothetical protein